jgi:hypothetical protein
MAGAKPTMAGAKPTRLPNQKTFVEIWNLIDFAVTAWSSHFSREVIACIFWEETAFRNIKNASGAVGFGQVVSTNFKAINDRFKTAFTVSGVLASDAFSVNLAVLFLEVWYETAGRSVDGALKGYGYYPHYRAYTRWKAAEADLKAVGLSGPIRALTADQVDQVAAALKKCSQPGFDPYAVL